MTRSGSGGGGAWSLRRLTQTGERSAIGARRGRGRVSPDAHAGRTARSAPAVAGPSRAAGSPRDPGASDRPRRFVGVPATAEDQQEEAGQPAGAQDGEGAERGVGRGGRWTGRGGRRGPPGAGAGDRRPMDGCRGRAGRSEHERCGQTGRTGQPGLDPCARRWHRQIGLPLASATPRSGGGHPMCGACLQRSWDRHDAFVTVGPVRGCTTRPAARCSRCKSCCGPVLSVLSERVARIHVADERRHMGSQQLGARVVGQPVGPAPVVRPDRAGEAGGRFGGAGVLQANQARRSRGPPRRRRRR